MLVTKEQDLLPDEVIAELARKCPQVKFFSVHCEHGRSKLYPLYDSTGQLRTEHAATLYVDINRTTQMWDGGNVPLPSHGLISEPENGFWMGSVGFSAGGDSAEFRGELHKLAAKLQCNYDNW